MLKFAGSIPALANAVSVGAKTVNGPVPLNVVTKSAFTSKSTSVSCMPVPWALVGISSVGPALVLTGILEAISSIIIKHTTFFRIILRKKCRGYNRMFYTTLI